MNKEEFQAGIKGKTVLVDFSAAWCRPCRLMEPIINEIMLEYQGKSTILKIDIDSQKDLATELMVQSIPTFIIFKDGKEMKRLVGVQSKSTIEKNLDKIS